MTSPGVPATGTQGCQRAIATIDGSCVTFCMTHLGSHYPGPHALKCSAATAASRQTAIDAAILAGDEDRYADLVEARDGIPSTRPAAATFTTAGGPPTVSKRRAEVEAVVYDTMFGIERSIAPEKIVDALAERGFLDLGPVVPDDPRVFRDMLEQARAARQVVADWGDNHCLARFADGDDYSAVRDAIVECETRSTARDAELRQLREEQTRLIEGWQAWSALAAHENATRDTPSECPRCLAWLAADYPEQVDELRCEWAQEQMAVYDVAHNLVLARTPDEECCDDD